LERPGYVLCNVCDKTYKHERADGEIIIHHYPAIGRFTAYTVRRASEEEAASVLRAQALLAPTPMDDRASTRRAKARGASVVAEVGTNPCSPMSTT